MKRNITFKQVAVFIIFQLSMPVIGQVNFQYSGNDIPFNENETITDIKATDLNNDGTDELIFLTSPGVQFYAYRWFGDHFQNIWYNYLAYSATAYGMQLTDFDNDGLTDFLVSWWGPDTYLSFIKNYGDIFVDQGVLAPYCPTGDFIAQDLDGDSLVDLAIGSVYSNSGYSVLFFKHDSVNQSVQYMGLLPNGVNGSNRVKPININGDDKMDIIAVEAYSGILYTYRNEKEFNFTRTYIHTFHNKVPLVEPADFNNDGLDDFVAAEFDSKLQFFINEGEGEFNMIHWGSADEKWTEVEAFDVNMDGLMDIIAMSSNCNIYFFKNMDNFNFEEMIYPNTDTLAYDLTLGDFDGNGAIDLVYGRNPAHVVFNVMNYFIPVSIDESLKLNSKEISISQNIPNPFTDFTTIELEMDKGKTGELLIFEQCGKVVFKSRIIHTQKKISISGELLKPGIYFYQLKTDDGVSGIKKMIKL